MKAVLQRVSEAKVVVEGKVVGEIGTGLSALIGIAKDDTRKDADKIVQSFWYWNSILPYIYYIVFMVVLLSVFTLLFKAHPTYKFILGILSSLIEVNLFSFTY